MADRTAHRGLIAGALGRAIHDGAPIVEAADTIIHAITDLAENTGSEDSGRESPDRVTINEDDLDDLASALQSISRHGGRWQDCDYCADVFILAARRVVTSAKGNDPHE